MEEPEKHEVRAVIVLTEPGQFLHEIPRLVEAKGITWGRETLISTGPGYLKIAAKPSLAKDILEDSAKVEAFAGDSLPEPTRSRRADRFKQQRRQANR